MGGKTQRCVVFRHVAAGLKGEGRWNIITGVGKGEIVYHLGGNCIPFAGKLYIIQVCRKTKNYYIFLKINNI